MTKAYLPKHERATKRVAFVLTDRDVEILRAVNRYRYLRTGQIRRLVFPENTTEQSARRRLKYLFHNGYLGRVMPFVRVGEGSSETAYYLDRAGRDILQQGGEEIAAYAAGGQVKHQFLDHALDISEFRVHLELALADHPAVEIHRFTADFEVKAHTTDAVGKRRYKLFDEVAHPVSKESYVVYPDALIVLRGKGSLEQYQRLYFVEIDRGTEGLNVIKDKIIGYSLYLKQNVFAKFGKFKGFVVLFQTNSKKRADNIRHFLTGVDGAELVWITDASQVTQETIATAPIWQDHERKARAILKG
jgi:hypothetical protein